jgi:predicted amidohydrolase YtcJ
MRLAADVVLVAGKVITWSEEEPEAQALAVGRGRILAVGKRAEAMGYAGPETRVIDLGGRVVLPGFTDCHTHLASVGSRLSDLDLWDVASLEELKAKVRKAARSRPPGGWILGRNWDESRWPERRYPTRHDLDSVASKHPVALTRVDGHMVVVNSAALGRLSLGDREGAERDPQGRPTGILKEEAAQAVWEATEPSAGTIVDGLRRMVETAHSLGITSIHDTVNPSEVRAYLHLLREGGLRLRVNLMPRSEGFRTLKRAGISTGLGGHQIRLGPLKAFLDGSLGARTAALEEDFEDEPGNRGLLMRPEDEALSFIREASSLGFQLALHAIGDRAIDLALRGLADAGTGGRHRIEHFELPREEHLKAARRLGVVASMQPNFVGRWSLPGGLYEERLGKDRLRRNNPFRLIMDEGIPLVFGSDHMPFSPLYGIHWAVNAPFEAQRLTVEEALQCYTHTPAYASFEEHVKGTIEPGKVADLVVLGKDPFRVPDRIEDIQVQMTIFDGEVVYRRA